MDLEFKSLTDNIDTKLFCSKLKNSLSHLLGENNLDNVIGLLLLNFALDYNSNKPIYSLDSYLNDAINKIKIFVNKNSETADNFEFAMRVFMSAITPDSEEMDKRMQSLVTENIIDQAKIDEIKDSISNNLTKDVGDLLIDIIDILKDKLEATELLVVINLLRKKPGLIKNIHKNINNLLSGNFKKRDLMLILIKDLELMIAAFLISAVTSSKKIKKEKTHLSKLLRKQNAKSNYLTR